MENKILGGENILVEHPRMHNKYCFQLPNSFVVTEIFQKSASWNHEIWPVESVIFEAYLSAEGVINFVELILGIG